MRPAIPSIAVGLIASLAGAAAATPPAGVSDAEYLARMATLNRQASTRPATTTKPAAVVVPATPSRSAPAPAAAALADPESQRRRSDVLLQIRTIDQRLAAIAAEGTKLEQYRDYLRGQQASDLKAAESAGVSTIHTEVWHRPGGRIELGAADAAVSNPYQSVAARREVEDRYGAKLEPVVARISALATEYADLTGRRSTIAATLRGRQAVTPPPGANDATSVNDELARTYPGVDIAAVWQQSLSDAAAAMNIDPDKTTPETEAGRSLEDAANRLFHKRAAAAAAKAAQPDAIVAPKYRGG